MDVVIILNWPFSYHVPMRDIIQPFDSRISVQILSVNQTDS